MFLPQRLSQPLISDTQLCVAILFSVQNRRGTQTINPHLTKVEEQMNQNRTFETQICREKEGLTHVYLQLKPRSLLSTTTSSFLLWAALPWSQVSREDRGYLLFKCLKMTIKNPVISKNWPWLQLWWLILVYGYWKYKYKSRPPHEWHLYIRSYSTSADICSTGLFLAPYPQQPPRGHESSSGTYNDRIYLLLLFISGWGNQCPNVAAEDTVGSKSGRPPRPHWLWPGVGTSSCLRCSFSSWLDSISVCPI